MGQDPSGTGFHETLLKMLGSFPHGARQRRLSLAASAMQPDVRRLWRYCNRRTSLHPKAVMSLIQIVPAQPFIKADCLQSGSQRDLHSSRDSFSNPRPNPIRFATRTKRSRWRANRSRRSRDRASVGSPARAPSSQLDDLPAVRPYDAICRIFPMTYANRRLRQRRRKRAGE